jgi:hypothetical protein
MALRARLKLVGASERETKQLLDKATELRMERASRSHLSYLVDAANQSVGKALLVVDSALRTPSSERQDDRQRSASEDVLDLRSELVRAKAFLKGCHDDLARNVNLDRSLAAATVERTETKLHKVTAEVHNMQRFAESTKLNIADVLYCEISLMRLHDWLEGGALNELWESIDSLLGYLYSQHAESRPKGVPSLTR